MIKMKERVFIYDRGVCILSAFLFLIVSVLATTSSAEVLLLPGKGRALIRHNVDVIGGYQIYHKWRGSGTKSSIGKNWVSSLDVFLSLEEVLPIAIVQADCRNFVYEKDNTGHFVNPAEKETRLKYSGDNYLLGMKNGTELRFSADGDLQSIHSITGETVTIFVVDRSQINGWITDTNKRGVIRRNKDGTVAAIRTPSGSFSYEYRDGYLAGIASEQGDVWRYSYDKKGRPVRVEEPGHVYTMSYDTNGRISTLEDSEGETRLIEYEKEGNVDIVHVWSSLKTHTVYRYSADTTVIEEGPTDDALNSRTTIELATGKVEIKKRDGTNIELLRDKNNTARLTVSVPGSLPVKSHLDSKGRIITSASGQKVFGEIVEDDKSPGDKGALHLDNAIVKGAHGEIKKLISAGKEIVSYKYDQKKNLTAVQFINGAKVAISYGPQDRITELIDVYGVPRKYLYDDQKRTRTERLSNGQNNVSVYDSENNLIEFHEPLGRIAKFHYDEKELSGLELVNLDTQEWFSSKADQVSSFTSTLRGNWFFKHIDQAGSSTRVSPGGHFVSYIVSPKGRLHRIEDENEKVLATYEYNPQGYLIRAENDVCEMVYKHDRYGRVVGQTDTDSAISIDYTYNGKGFIGELKDSLGHTLKFFLNDTDAISKVQSNLAGIFKIKYNEMQLPTILIRPNGVQTEWDYDVGGRLKEMKHVFPDGKAIFEKYRYDKMGNIIETETSEKGRYRYTYDKLSYITSIESDKTGKLSVSYDAWGNLLKFASTSFHYASPGEIASAGKNRITIGEASRILKIQSPDSHYYFEYDWDEKLKRVSKDGKALAEWQYGPLGRLVLSVDENKKSKRYYYALGRLYAVKEQTAPRPYIYILLPGMDICIAVVKPDGAVVFPLTDSKGSIRYLTNSQGHLVSSIEYNFFGLPQQLAHSDLSLGYANGLFFLNGKILMLGGQTYWLPLARVLTAPAVQPGTNGLSQTNPLPFSLVNMNHPVQ